MDESRWACLIRRAMTGSQLTINDSDTRAIRMPAAGTGCLVGGENVDVRSLLQEATVPEKSSMLKHSLQ